VRSSQLATVFLDLELCLVKFTPDCVDVFPLIETDIGRPLRELQSRLAGITTEDLLAHVTRVLAKLEASELEATTTNGHSFLVRILPYRNHDERVEGVVLTFIDISDARAARTAAAASEERLRIAVRSAPLVMISLAGQRVEWGYAYGEPLAPPATAFALFTRASYDRLIALGEQVARTGSGARVELELVIAGQARTHDFRIEPSALGVIAVGFDITPRKLAEASLIEIDRRKDEFLATLSHELRNPLTPLTVALDIAKLAPHDPAIQAEAREIMEHQVRQLSRLVDELLDLSRITRGKIEIRRERVDVVHAAQLAIEATRPLVVQHNHTLDVEVSATAPCVVGDEARLVQIVTNLLTNAAKYTPDGGRLELAITIDRDGGRVAIRVRDNGIGIAADKLGEIFDMFFQSRDARGRSQGGLGIGLNLVHRLVALHGGSVRATSDGPGRGSEFVVELPLAA